MSNKDNQWYAGHAKETTSGVVKPLPRKAKQPVIIKESRDSRVAVTLEYEGKLYQGVLYPIEGKESQ